MKTVNLKTGIATAILALALSSFANAQQQRNDQKKPPTFAELLKELDANEDGNLAESEVKGPLKDDFAKIDTDEDGFISEKELKNAPKPKGGKRKSK
jgi:Ca2+-binding EF-hand superfamily protein